MTALRQSLAFLAVGAVLLGACTGAPQPDPRAVPRASTSEQPVDAEVDERLGGTLRIGLAVDPVSIDPRFVVDDEGEMIVDALFDPLVRLDERARVVPAAAESWAISDDGRVFTFHLARAAFHDGTSVTAEDFKRTFDRIADGTASPPSFLAYLLAPVVGSEQAQTRGGGLSGVVAVDARTLVVRLSEPQPAFIRTFADPSLVPVPASADADLERFAAQPVGNGPFAMREPREPGGFLRLSRNEDHRAPPLLDEVVFQIYLDDLTRDRQWEDLADGQLQVAEVPADQLEEAVARYGESPDGYHGPGLLDGITSTVYLYGFDTTQAPFDDPRIRRAISLAIDRDALADDVMQGTRAPADALVPPPFRGSQRGICEHCRHDPAAALELLDEVRADQRRAEEAEQEREDADGTDEEAPEPVVEATVVPDRMTLTHNRGRTHAAIAERMASDIEAALGIEVALAARDLQPFVQSVRRGEVPVFRLGWDPGESDAGAYLYPLFHSSQVGRDNVTRYENDEVDALLDQARTSRTEDAAAARYREAERRILEEAPVLPLLWYRHAWAVAPAVQDLYWSPLGRINLPSVWLDVDA